MPTYSIRNWKQHFETPETLRLKRMSWFACPNKHDGKGYKRFAKLPGFMEMLSAWYMILAVASKCPVRGVLKDEDGPLTAEDIAISAEGDAKIIQKALDILSASQHKIRWIDTIDSAANPQQSPQIPTDCCTQVLTDVPVLQDVKDPPTPQGVDVPPLSQNELDAQRLADVYRAYSKCTNLKEKSYSHWFDALSAGIKPADIEAEIIGGNKLRPPWNILKALDRETLGRARDSPARRPPKRYEPIGDLARAPRKAIGPEDPLP